jgi:hypothetical protein
MVIIMFKVVKVKYCIGHGRIAGWGSSPEPPKDVTGKKVFVSRALIGWHAYWCSYEEGKMDFVLSHAELYDGTKDECDCSECNYIRKMRQCQQG